MTHSATHSLPYRDFRSYLRSRFPYKVQKISLNAGLSCPNRDGTLGRGGCIYCNNYSFAPGYTHRTQCIARQVREGIDFFRHKYPEMRYLAYFQAYTATYGETLRLIEMYEEALCVDGVEGIILGTRPDCVSDDLLKYLGEKSRDVFVYLEYGLESTLDATLEYIHRGHTFGQCRRAVERTVEQGIDCGVHLILGLPGENKEEMLGHAHRISKMPITSVKLHQLQVLRNTPLEAMYRKDPTIVRQWEADDYIAFLGEFITHLRPDIYLDRFVSQAPGELLLAPRWSIKNHVFTDRLVKYLRANTLYQGKYYPFI